VLGTFAVLARRSLVGDALSHAALPGVALAFIVTGTKDPATLLVGAAVAGLLAALMIVGVERTSRIRPDAAIGVVLSSFFSLGVVLLTYISSQGNAQQAGLETYLFGQAAGLLLEDVRTMAVLAAVALTVVVAGFRPLKVATFDREFAASVGLRLRVVELASTTLLVVAIVIGLRMVGAILMVAMLIVPAVAARQLTGRLSAMLVIAGAIGAAVGASGSLLSARAQVPTGPVIVLVGTAVVLAAILFAPRRGVAWRAARACASAAARRPTPCSSTSRRPPRSVSLHRRRVHHGECPAAPGGAGHPAPPRTGRPGDERRRPPAALTGGASSAREALQRRVLWSAWLEHGWRLALTDAREPDPRDCAAAWATRRSPGCARCPRRAPRERCRHHRAHGGPGGHACSLLGPFLIVRRVALLGDAVSHAVLLASWWLS